MILMMLSFIRRFLNKARNHGWKILCFALIIICVVAANNDVKLYKHVDCLLGDGVLATLETPSRVQCALHCRGQSGAGFSYVSESRNCTTFKQMFIDQSQCGLSSDIYGRIDACTTVFRGNYTAQHPFMGDNSLARYRCKAFNDQAQVDYCPISRCGLFSTPASLSCSANDIFDINNPQYEGMVSCTVRGVTCQRWDTSEPHQVFYFKGRSDLHNWCQQHPEARPWCYTTDPETQWDYCPVEERLVCDSSPPTTLLVSNVTLERPYNDLLSVGRYRCDTLENKEPEESCPVTRCLSNGSWSTASISCSDKECYDPTNRLYNGRVTCTVTGITCQRWDSEYPHPEAGYVGQSSDHGNRCQMSGRIRPWCFTMNPEVKWDFCPVDKCT